MNKENRDKTEDTIYGINSEQQQRIYNILNYLDIQPRKKQNINFINIKVEIEYFEKN